jgi:hypothetical protein
MCETYQTKEDNDSLNVELGINTPSLVPLSEDENYQSEDGKNYNEKEFLTPHRIPEQQDSYQTIPLVTLTSVRYYRGSTLSNTFDEERREETKKIFTGILLLIPFFLGGILLYYLFKS